MKMHRIVLLGAALAAAGPAHAAGVGVRLGTLGYGGDFGWHLAPTLNARLGYSAYSHDSDVTSTNVHYDGKLKLSNLPLLVDFSPFGPFHLTAGVVGNNNRIDVTGAPTNNQFVINNTTYTASQVGSLSGRLRLGNRAAPYLGIGWGNVAGAGVNFYADLGVMFMGSPKASLSATCGSGLSAGQCAQLQSDVEAEQRALEDKVKKYKYYPVLNIGLTIGF
jgi:hypothetical protein